MLEALSFLFPGFIFIVFATQNKFEHEGQQWPYLLKISIYSLALILIARISVIIIFGIFHLFSLADWIPHIRDGWHLFVPIPFSLTLILSIFLAVPFGLVVQSWDKENKHLSLLKKIGLESDEKVDPIERQLTELMTENPDTKNSPYAIIEITNGKVYWGTLLDYTKTDDLNKIVLLFAPHMSGRKFKLKTVYSVAYKKNINADQQKSAPLTITIPYREIASVREFDLEFFNECIKNGTIVFSKELKASMKTLT